MVVDSDDVVWIRWMVVGSSDCEDCADSSDCVDLN